MHRWLLLVLCLWLPGCLVAIFGVGAGAGILTYEAFVSEDTYEGVFAADLDDTFRVALDVMNDITFENPPTHDRDLYEIEGEVNGSDVRIKVGVYDAGKASLKVTARKNLLADKDTAVQVFRKIERRLTDGR